MADAIRRAGGAILPPLGLIAGLLLAMEALQRGGLLPITVPAPSAVAAAFGRSHGDLFYHMVPTVLSAAAGLATATALALALGGLATGWPASERSVLRFGIVVDSIPLLALTPILMVWVGNGLLGRIVIATIAALFPLLVGVVQGFRSVERNLAELFHVMAASRWQRLRRLAWPSALPFLFAALKVAAPLSVLGTLIAEWVSADRGLGIMMTYALFSFDVPLAWLTIAAVCAIAVLAYGAVAGAEWLVLRRG